MLAQVFSRCYAQERYCTATTKTGEKMSIVADFKIGTKVKIAPALIKDPAFAKVLTMQGIDPQKLEQNVGMVIKSGTMKSENAAPYDYVIVRFPNINFPMSEQKFERNFNPASLVHAQENTVAQRPGQLKRRVRGKMPTTA